MNQKQKPDLHDLSLYYDGLLDQAKSAEIEAQLEQNQSDKRMLDVFKRLESALDSDLEDDRIDQLLNNNLTGIHERLIQEEKTHRKQSISIWDWMLMPRNLLAGLAGLLILFGVFSSIGPMDQGSSSVVASVPITNDDQDDPMIQVNNEEPVVDETQKQVIIAATGFAKSAFYSGFGYAKEQSKPIGKTFSALPQTSDLGIALKAFTSSASHSDKAASSGESVTLSANQLLARTSVKQLALGLGASLITLVSVI
jgi:hypothetical protein